MKADIVRITFGANAQSCKDGRLTVPLRVVTALGLVKDGPIGLEISSHAGTTVGVYAMKSGTEVYETRSRNAGLRQVVARGERLLVTASRADAISS